MSDFTSIIQDVGRAFGYGERPNLRLSNEADEFLNNIWDTETDYLSMENLENMTRVVLGKHMQRKKRDPPESAEHEYENNAAETDNDEDEEPLPDLELVQYFYEAISHPGKCMFMYNLEPQAFEHRLILKAEPQNGKTGAFLYLIKLLCQKIRPKAVHNIDKWKNSLAKITKLFYYEFSTDEIEEYFKTPEGQTRHQKYIELLKFSREKRQRDSMLEPAKWAALALVEHLKEATEKGSVVIADFGCGDMQFSTFFIEKIKELDFLQKIKINIFGFDFTTNPIDELTDLPSNVKVETR